MLQEFTADLGPLCISPIMAAPLVHYQILLIEDSPQDEFLTRLALERADLAYSCHVISTGLAGLQYVQSMGLPDGPKCPDLLIVDLNLPLVTGQEIIREFRAGNCRTPIIVSSSTDNPAEKAAVQRLGVACFFTKPTRLEPFMVLGSIAKNLLAGRPAQQGF